MVFSELTVIVKDVQIKVIFFYLKPWSRPRQYSISPLSSYRENLALLGTWMEEPEGRLPCLKISSVKQRTGGNHDDQSAGY